MRYITRQLRIDVVLTGKDRLASLSPTDRVVDLTGRLSHDGLVATIAGARLVLTSDSAPLHLAVALGVPAVVIAGSGLPGRYHPYPSSLDRPAPQLAVVSTPIPCAGCHWRCVERLDNRGPAPCVEDVPVLPVLRALRRALANPEAAA